MQIILKLFKFFGRLFRFVRNFVINIVFICFVLIMAAVIGLMVNNQENQVLLEGNQGALWLNLDGYLTDNRAATESWRTIMQELDNSHISQQISTFDVVYAIENAAHDERIKGLVLDLAYFEGADLPALTYIGKAINNFKQTNKPVIALADNYDQRQYLLASYADEIYLNPVGEVDIHGLVYENLYFKSLLDKLDITAHVFRVGTYKSAVEPFLRDDMSAEAKQNAQQWLSQMWQSYQQIVANNRHIKKEQVLPESRQFLAELKKLNGNMTAYSLQRNLVTKLATGSQRQQALIERFGADDEHQVKAVDFNTYLAALPDRLVNKEGNKIAVINVEGTIVDGYSNLEEGDVGGDSIANLLRQAHDDENVKAVILRINSPGGSAFASEIIRQEIAHLQAANKIVVASMGGMAASGGYWIASNADYIIADRNTLTGSIGIFSLFPTFEKSINRIGVNADGISTSKLAELSAFQQLSPENNELLQLQIEYGYDQFLELVSKGRKLSKAQVDKVAQGQVWIGSDALKHKLVDELGDFDLAVDKAQQLVTAATGEKDLALEWQVEEEPQLWQRLLHSGQTQAKSIFKSWLLNSIGVNPSQYQSLRNQIGLLHKFNDPKGQYLYCLSCGTLK